jgi:hypothetical protein
MLKEENGNRESIELIDMLIEENQELMRPYNLMCKDEQFLKVNQNWV